MNIKKTLKHGTEIGVMIGFLLLFSILMCVINRISIKNGISFWIFQVGGILLPGMAATLLCRFKKLSKLEFTAISYAVGYCLNIILYYITVPFGGGELLKYVALVIALVSLFIIYKNWGLIESYQRDGKGNIVCLIFIMVLAFIEIFTVCARNFYPPNVEQNVMAHDMLYWVGNTISLTRGYPPVNFREYTWPYTYHYLSSMQLSVITLVTNIRPVILSFGFSFIQPIMIMVTGLYILFRKFTKQTWLAVAGMAVLLLVEGQVDQTSITYINHVLAIQFGFDIGMGIYTFFLIFLLSQWKEEKFDLRWCILSVVFGTITAGLKSPFGAIGVGAAGILCLGWLLRKQWKKAFGYGIPILAGFLIMYAFVINLGNSDQPEASIIQTLFMEPRIYTLSPLIKSWHESMTEGAFILFKPFLELVIMLCGLVVINFCIFVPFFYFLGMKLLVLRKWDLLDSMCAGVIAVGTVITMKWGNPDFSAAYFVMAAYIPAVLFSVRTIQQLAVKGGGIFCGIRKWTLIISGIVLLCSGTYEACTRTWGWVTDFKIGIQNLFAPEKNNAYFGDRAYISMEDYEAYEWIRANTSEDTLIACNKGLQLGRGDTSRHSRVMGVFMERYVIANDASDALFYDLDYTRLEELKQTGVEYILYNTTATEGFALPPEQIVYANDTNVIYQLVP